MQRIPLTRGLFAIVDDDDYEKLAAHKWCANKANYNAIYAIRGIWDKEEKKTVFVSMHRVIMGASKGQQVDHINGDKLDNRKANLRLCESKENQWNMRPRASGSKGVHFCKRRAHLPTPWQAYITISKKRIHIGYYVSQQNAQDAYNAEALARFGQFARPA